MQRLHLRVLVAVVLVAGLLVAGVAMLLVTTQGRARADLEGDLKSRAALAARMTSGALSSSNTGEFQKAYFNGPDAGLQKAMAGYQGEAPEPQAYVLDAEGRLLAALPKGRLGDGLLRVTPSVRAALAGGEMTMSNVFRAGTAKPMIALAIPIETPHGRRVVVDIVEAALISDFVKDFFARAPSVAGARAYMLDEHDRLLATSTRERVGGLVREPGLGDLLRGADQGSIGDRYATSVPIAGTPWRVAFVAPHGSLYASVHETHLTAWGLYIGFAIAILGLLGLGGATMRRSGLLALAQEREGAASRLAHERLHDALTGLPNRALFLDRVEHALAATARRPGCVAVVFLDIDHFKRINDSLGHGVGDELLEIVARRLKDALRPEDTVSRFGGDEFVMLCADLHDVDDALRIASRAQAALKAPIELGERAVRLASSIGMVVHGLDDPDTDAPTLVRDADTAMHRAKERGRGGAELFDAALHHEALARLDTEAALRDAARSGELRLHYQPIVELATGDVTGVEALVRWERPGIGLVPPAEFIGLAEESGLISGIGDWVLEHAMADAAEWRALGLVDDDFTLSVNLSPRQLVGDGLETRVRNLLGVWALPARSLCLEVTESAVAQDPLAAARTLTELSACGVQLAIDDFGVGQSSLEHLGGTLHVDVLKLDRMFVANMDQPRERAIVSAVATLAHDLDVVSVAEGVETEAQAEAVARLGYARGQGYYWGRPCEARAIVGRLALSRVQAQSRS